MVAVHCDSIVAGSRARLAARLLFVSSPLGNRSTPASLGRSRDRLRGRDEDGGVLRFGERDRARMVVRSARRSQDILDHRDRFSALVVAITAPVFVVSNGPEVFMFSSARSNPEPFRPRQSELP